MSSPQAVGELLAPGLEFNDIGIMAMTGNWQRVDELLNSATKENNLANMYRDDAEGGCRPLHYAAWEADLQIVNKLLDRGADPLVRNIDGETPLTWAVKRGGPVAFQLLDRMAREGHLMYYYADVSNANVEMQCKSPWLWSAQANTSDFGLMEWLYLQGHDIDEVDFKGGTMLHTASWTGSRKTVQWLLSRGADLALPDFDQLYPIHYATISGWECCAQALLAAGSAPLLSTKDASNEDCLTLAANRNHHYIHFILKMAQVTHALFGVPHIFRNSFSWIFPVIWGIDLIAIAGMLYHTLVTVANREAASSETIASVFSIDSIYFAFGFHMVLASVVWTGLYKSDPGAVGKNPTITPQIVSKDAETRVRADLPQCERDLKEISLLRRRILSLRYRAEEDPEQELHLSQEEATMLGVPTNANFTGAQLNPSITNAINHVTNRLLPAMQRCKEYRQNELRNGGKDSALYLDYILKGKFKEVCTMSRCVKKFRAHYISDNGAYVERFDHHCHFIDNSVGLKNQRMFYTFLWVLLACFATFFVLVFRYLQSVGIFELPEAGDLFNGQKLVSSINATFEPDALGLAFLAVINIPPTAFVCLLIARTTACMVMNLTWFEALTAPQHVKSRFPKASAGGSLCDTLLPPWLEFNVPLWVKNIIKFWTLSQEGDEEYFAPKSRGNSTVEMRPMMHTAESLASTEGSPMMDPRLMSGVVPFPNGGMPMTHYPQGANHFFKINRYHFRTHITTIDNKIYKSMTQNR